MSWRHNDLANDLAAYIRQKSGRVVWTDMQLGPVGSPRPDVYTIEPSFTRFRPMAYEIKVSGSDYRRDVVAGKWQSYLPFAAGVIFAVPAGLISKNVLPEGCGLMARGAEGWRTVKAPTLRPIQTLPHQAWIKLFIDGLGREVERRVAESRPDLVSEWQAHVRVGNVVGQHVRQILGDRAAATSHYERETRRLAETSDGISVKIREQELFLMERSRRDAARIDAARAELAEALGLPADAPIGHISSAAADAAFRLTRDGEVVALRAALRSIQRTFDEVKAPAIAGEDGS